MLYLEYSDLTDGTGLSRLVHKIKPDEVYNLAPKATSVLVLMYRNIRAMLLRWVRRVYSKPFTMR